MCIELSYDTDVIFNLMDVMLSSVANHYYASLSELFMV